MKRFLGLLFIGAFFVLGITACPNPTPDPTPNGGSSNSISIILPTQSATPLSPLKIATTGLSKSGPVSISWTNSSGFSVTNDPVSIESDGSVVAAVPLYVDPASADITSGTVSVVFTQGGVSSPPITITIENLPPLSDYGVSLGRISSSFYAFQAMQLANRINQLQAGSLLLNGSVDTTTAVSTLKTLLKATISARGDVERIMVDNSLVITDVLANGTQINFDKNSVEIMDRLTGQWLTLMFMSSTAKPTASPFSKSLRDACLSSPADMPTLLVFLDDFNQIPGMVQDMQESLTKEKPTDAALAFVKGASTFLQILSPNSPLGKFAGGVGPIINMFGILQATTNSIYDLAAYYGCVNYGGDPACAAKVLANMNSDTTKLYETSISTASLGLISVVPPGSANSYHILGLDLALTQANTLLSLAGLNTDDTTASVAGMIGKNVFPSPQQGLAQIQGTATPQSSLNLCCVGTSQLGIDTLADSNGNYRMWVPAGVSNTNYSNLTLSSADITNGSNLSSATVDLTGLNTSQPILLLKASGKYVVSLSKSATNFRPRTTGAMCILVPPTCPNGATDYPTCTPPICSNGATDYPTCTPPTCPNGGTNYPTCTAPSGTCSNGATDYPTCTPPTCSNGGTNYPTCTPPSTGSEVLTGTGRITGSISSPNANGCTPDPLVLTLTSTQSLSITVNGHLETPGTYSAVFNYGGGTQTDAVPAYTCQNPSGTNTIPASTTSYSLPSGSSSGTISSNGSTLTFNGLASSYNGCTFSGSGSVMVQAVTGIVGIIGSVNLTCQVSSTTITENFQFSANGN